MHLPMWQLGDKFDFHVYVSTSEEEIFVNNKFDGVEDPPHPNPVESVGKGGLLWKQTGLFFDTRQGQNMTFERNFTKKDMPFPYLNGSVYLHAYFTRTASGSRHQYDMGTADIQHGSIPLVLHAKRPKAKRTKNLISGDISEKVRGPSSLSYKNEDSPERALDDGAKSPDSRGLTSSPAGQGDPGTECHPEHHGGARGRDRPPVEARDVAPLGGRGFAVSQGRSPPAND